MAKLSSSYICILASTFVQRDEDRLKASMRRQIKQKRVKDRATNKGLTKGYLEGEEDDEDDASFSISKIKNAAKNAKNRGSKGEMLFLIYVDLLGGLFIFPFRL